MKRQKLPRSLRLDPPEKSKDQDQHAEAFRRALRRIRSHGARRLLS